MMPGVTPAQTASPDAGQRQPVRIVLNAHGPAFYRYSMLCIRSIRRVCGMDVPISVYQPDNLPPVPQAVRRFYDSQGVDIRGFRNEFLPYSMSSTSDVPARLLTLNKLYCLQDMHPGERRLFVDADVIFLRDPRAVLDAIGTTIAVPPVDTPEAFGGDWAELYSEMGVPFPDTSIEVWERYSWGDAPEPPRVRMIPYFSSGVVYVEGESALPRLWMDMCRRLEARIDLVPRSFFLDQIALSLAVRQSGEDWTLLSRAMNCTYEVWRYTPEVRVFHYVGLDTLSAAVARFADVRSVCRDIVPTLARSDGLDLRLQVLTQWPRWYRRGLGLVRDWVEKLAGRPIWKRRERA